jgi:hypothetical protein
MPSKIYAWTSANDYVFRRIYLTFEAKTPFNQLRRSQYLVEILNLLSIHADT